MVSSPQATPRPFGPSDLSGWLSGRWSVQRAINGDEGVFSGIADFGPGPQAPLVWSETGRLQLGAHAGPARRTLLMAPGARAGSWSVSFDDHRPFHELDLRSGRWAAEHACGRDLYRGIYELHGENRFTVVWRVAGPGRDDVIASDYRRAGIRPGGTGRPAAPRSAQASARAA